ncbi:hypothetical protein [Kitasatospora sp. NPDC002040]|uniref:hypothetical protein n=1 Tax=Kitasatospora sp. NPDC002040 TaxID=3154661 RepID=UPI00331C67CE
MLTITTIRKIKDLRARAIQAEAEATETAAALEAALTLTASPGGWTPAEPPVDGDLAAVLRYVDAGVRDEAAWRAAGFAEQHFDSENSLGLALPERWTGLPDGSAVHYLGAGQWLHYHPGRSKSGTARSSYYPAAERIGLLFSRSVDRDVQPLMSLADLLERLGACSVDYRVGQSA